MENTIINVRCNLCQVNHEVTVPVEGFKAWQNGELIQRALPTVSLDNRELLISKTCGPCFDKMFGGK
jgi:hypothetical protein